MNTNHLAIYFLRNSPEFIFRITLIAKIIVNIKELTSIWNTVAIFRPISILAFCTLWVNKSIFFLKLFAFFIYAKTFGIKNEILEAFFTLSSFAIDLITKIRNERISGKGP